MADQTDTRRDGLAKNRRPSVFSRRLSAAESAEYEQLLPNGFEPTLYKTLSHSSNFAPSNADIDEEAEEPLERPAGVYTTLSVLLVGVFVSQTDQSFVLATYGAVSSEFHDLDSGSWLVSAYILAQCVAQPLYGKLSDIYGRKACLQGAYILFAIGTTMSGLGRSMGEVIAGRAVQGSGGAGMISMVSIIIADLVPLNEVAQMWSYINILQTTGRSCGGFIGGLLTQSLGWRLAFLIQVPPVVLAILLVQWRLHLPTKVDNTGQSTWEKLARVDFVGAAFLCFTIFAACFAIDTGGQKVPWNSPIMIGILTLGGVSAVLFVVSAKYVKEPIFPLRLIAHYDAGTAYLFVWLQITIQMSLMMAVPLYFQATKGVGTAAAGAYLIPAFAGNTMGGLLAGWWIRRTGRYKWPNVLAPILSVFCVLLIFFSWNGNTSVLQSLFIFPGGFATGMTSSSAFVAMAAGVAPEDIAIAGSGIYLFFNIGAISGSAAGGALYQGGLRSKLAETLDHVKGGQEIMQRLLEDIKYLWTLNPDLRQTVMPAYVEGLHRVMMLGFVCAVLSFVIAIFTRQHRLKNTSAEASPGVVE